MKENDRELRSHGQAHTCWIAYRAWGNAVARIGGYMQVCGHAARRDTVIGHVAF